jgi:diguanylate cyclase (GGDEF)-like protein
LRQQLDRCLGEGEALRMPDPKRASAAAQQALALAHRLNDQARLAVAETLYGRITSDLGRNQEGLKYVLSALRRHEKLDDQKGLCAVLTAAGLIYCELGAFDEGLSALERAERIAAALGDDLLQLRALGNMGLMYADLQIFDRARSLIEQALKLAQKLDHAQLRLRSKCNLGHVDVSHGKALLAAGDHAAAQVKLLQARAILFAALATPEINDSPYDMALTNLNLGSVHYELGELAQAHAYLLAAEQGQIQVGDESSLIETRLQLALLTARRERTQASVDAVGVLIEQIDEKEAGVSKSRAWLDFSLLAEKIGFFPAALAAYKNFHNSERQMMSERTASKAAALAVKLDMEHAQLEADVLRIHAEHLVNKNEQLAQEATVLSRHAREDALTQLHNRRHFDEQFPPRLAQIKATQVKACLALADLDHFKLVNDKFSHTVGDQVLRRVSALLRTHSRTSDLVARYGGEEFVVVLHGLDLAQALIVCERLRNSVQQSDWSDIAPGLSVTVSIGLTECEPGRSAEQLIAAADQLLYRAKSEGRNRVCA